MSQKPRKHCSSEEKFRIVLDVVRREGSIAELFRLAGISRDIFYKWPTDFLESGKRRIVGATAKVAKTNKLNDMRKEARNLKEVVAEYAFELRLLKKMYLSPSRQIPLQPPAGQSMGATKDEVPRICEAKDRQDCPKPTSNSPTLQCVRQRTNDYFPLCELCDA